MINTLFATLNTFIAVFLIFALRSVWATVDRGLTGGEMARTPASAFVR
jgi:hypothetical protein